MTPPFRFKQFTVHQDRCAMKVGTDGVLLGAWTSVAHGPKLILDIGTGSGLIALQMAQRCAAAKIDAVEIDVDAYAQCVENFEGSPWTERLRGFHTAFQKFAETSGKAYDLIVSNPPYHTESTESPDKGRIRARQNKSLPFDVLLGGVAKLLADGGRFSMIAPFGEERGIVAAAADHTLFPLRITRVQGNPSAPVKRSLLEFTGLRESCDCNVLILEEERHRPTEAYRTLTKDFYLNL